jgi:hypothetical protein
MISEWQPHTRRFVELPDYLWERLVSGEIIRKAITPPISCATPAPKAATVWYNEFKIVEDRLYFRMNRG